MSYDSIGNVMNTVNTNRNINIDVNGDIANNGLNVHVEETRDSTNHFAGVSKMVDTEIETVTKGNWLESFCKWLGIVLGIAIVGYVIYLCIRKKLRLKMFV